MIVTKCQNIKSNLGYQYTAIHLNIHSLPSKHVQLRSMLANLHDVYIIIDFIMLNKTFLSDVNQNMCPLPGYLFFSNNIFGEGVPMYIRQSFQYKILNDLTMNISNEFTLVNIS